MNAQPVEQIDHMRGKSDTHAHVAEGIFQDQVPADDPGHQLAHGGVGIGVGRSGDGDHAAQFGVTQPGKAADDRHQHHGQREGRSGAGTARDDTVMMEEGRRVQQKVDDRRLGPLRVLDRVPGDRRADHSKDARANHRTHTKSGQGNRSERLLQRRFRLFRFRDELIDRLGLKNLTGQRRVLEKIVCERNPP